MKAAWFETFGEPRDVLEIGHKDDPIVQDNEVLVDLRVSAVNPSDEKKRAGSFPDLLDDGFIIPHSDGAGIIVEVGKNISRNKIGERVWVYQGQFERRYGTAADLISIDSIRAPKLPENISFDVGACLGIPLMTAHRCVFADGSVKGKRLLITGGAGRVGYYTVQLAKNDGAFVIATASNKEDKESCLNIGADAVVNHKEKNWGRHILEITKGRKIHRAIDVDFGANLTEVLSCLGTGAIIATYASMQNPEPKIPFLKMMYMGLSIRLIIVYSMPEKAKFNAIKDISNLLSKDQIKHRIAYKVSLDEIHKSHEIIREGNARGGVLIEMS